MSFPVGRCLSEQATLLQMADQRMPEGVELYDMNTPGGTVSGWWDYAERSAASQVEDNRPESGVEAGAWIPAPRDNGPDPLDSVGMIRRYRLTRANRQRREVPPAI
jgi:hypothetical protein